MNKSVNLRWLLVGAAILICSLAGNWPALAWGPYAQQVIVFESGEPYADPHITRDPGGGPTAAPDVPHFIHQAAMPKAWEYLEGKEYAKTSEAYAQIVTKLAKRGGNDDQAQALRASQIADIIGDNMAFGSQTRTCHERWFYELLVDAVLHSGNFDTNFSLKRIRISSRPKLTAKASIAFVKIDKGDPISESAALAMTYDQALAMLGERVLVSNEQFQDNALHNTTPGLWIPALRTAADEVAKRLAGNVRNPKPVTVPMINQMERRGFEILKELGGIVAGSGTGCLKTSNEQGLVTHEIIVTDKPSAEKVVIDYLKDKVYRMKTEPITRTLCLDLLRLLTKELYGWSPTPLGDKPEA